MNYKHFDVFLDSIFVVDQELNLIFCNEASVALTGNSFPESFYGKPLSQWLKFEKGILKDSTTLPQTSDTTPYLDDTIRVGELSFSVRVSIQKLERGAGAPPHWLVVVRDVSTEADKVKTQIQTQKGAISKLEEAQTQLEQYSKNLEFMVRQRTTALNKTNNTLKAILNSLGQGLVVFNEQGTVSPISSKACETLFEMPPPYMWIQDILRVENKDKETFKMWIGHLFNETIPFDSVKDLGPRQIQTLSNKKVFLDYFPIRNDDKKITSVVLVATDKTDEMRARAEADKERNYVRMVLRISRNRRQFMTFLKDARDLIAGLGSGINALKADLASSGNQFVLDYTGPLAYFLRALHTLKGGAATFAITSLAEICHEMEDWLVTIKGIGDVLMKEEFDQIENYYQQVCNTLDSFLKHNEEILSAFGTSKSRQLEFSIDEMWRMSQELSQLPTQELRMTYLAREIFCEPIINSLAYLDEVIISTASVLGKQVTPIVFRNTNIKIFPEKYSGLFSTLVHAFRNAVDHGIEFPDERIKRGKPASGLIVVTCDSYSVDGTDWLKLSIQDDGGGIDPRIVRRKMAEKGISGYDTQTDGEVIQNVFLSQFSTKDAVTEISGRGVGLDAVKYEVEKLGGKIQISSELGKGTLIQIDVPNLVDTRIIERSLKLVA